MRFIVFISLFVVIFSCKKNNKVAEKTIENTNEFIVSDSLSIDLVALKEKGLLKNTAIITVENDPVYHKKKRFNAIPLKPLLEKYSSLKRLKLSEMNVIFECEDGYKPEMSLEKLVNAKAFLALSDVDAPVGAEWEKLTKDGHEMIAQPFYIIYEGVSPTDYSYKWSYNLIKIHFAPTLENEAFIKPNDVAALKGYELFKKNCKTCHAINKIGGNMGPELNYPKSVTEYWKMEDLKAFIKDPSSYRNDVKMPKLNLQNDDVDEIAKYLSAMAKQKI